jgi:proteasome accessory factor B
VIGTFSAKRGPKDFETPEDFDAQRVFEKSSHENAVVDIRRGKGTSLRALAIATKSMGEWDQVQIPILDMKTLSSLLLWHGDDVYVHSPADLRGELISSLKDLVNLHG